MARVNSFNKQNPGNLKTDSRIIPEKITQPIQLLGACLVCLLLIDGSFLLAASQIEVPSWAPEVLIIASIINVPIFLIPLFLLLTKFREKILTNYYYSKYSNNYKHSHETTIDNDSANAKDN